MEPKQVLIEAFGVEQATRIADALSKRGLIIMPRELSRGMRRRLLAWLGIDPDEAKVKGKDHAIVQHALLYASAYTQLVAEVENPSEATSSGFLGKPNGSRARL